MSDALGGVVNIGMVIFFITIIALYMAFNVNYQKAFNVKNEIVSLYEEYQGECNVTNGCKGKIMDYENKLGYSADTNVINGNVGGKTCFREYGYCAKVYEGKKGSTVYNNESKNSKYSYCYYDIMTFVHIDIPFINYFLNLRLFQITGQTKTMKVLNKCPVVK